VTLAPLRTIALPDHRSEGGFDHAAIDPARSRLYVAHTANDAVDVIDLEEGRYVRSLEGLPGVAGVWVSSDGRWLFTSNRGNDTASVFGLPEESEVARLSTGARPNGLAFDERTGRLLVAGVGDPARSKPPTATFFQVPSGDALGTIELEGRTRWAAYLPARDAFLTNIASPPAIAILPSTGRGPGERWAIPSQGPHGLALDLDAGVGFCACDSGDLLEVDLDRGTPRTSVRLAGVPDVLWLHPELGHLYAAVGDPGVVQVFGTAPLRLIETVPTGPGAHTLVADAKRRTVHVFRPEAHDDLVLEERLSDG
jgi:DNA-binding beta-propeller fold protein YncE